MSDSKVLDVWTEMKVLVESLEKDMGKNAVKHNVSAGVRVRKGLRLLKRHASTLLRESLVADKAVVEERKAKKAAAGEGK
jgi:hypothetical protein